MGRNKWNKTNRLKAIRKNYIDKDKEKKGIFCEAGAFYLAFILLTHFVKLPCLELFG